MSTLTLDQLDPDLQALLDMLPAKHVNVVQLIATPTPIEEPDAAAPAS